MDEPRQTLSALDELRRMRADVQITRSMDVLRRCFDRLQEIRREYLDDFHIQILVSDTHQEIIERARLLRHQMEAMDSRSAGAEELPEADPDPVEMEEPVAQAKAAFSDVEPVPEKPVVQWHGRGAEIPDDVPKLDPKSWKLAVGLAIFFTVGVFALFFYLIQTARRLNFGDSEASNQTAKATAAPNAGALKPASATTPPVITGPALRLFTDLSGGTVTTDDQPEKDLADGELEMNSLVPGVHTVKVEGKSGSAAFTFALDNDKEVPRVTQILKSSNAMAVLVSVKNGTGRLITDAEGARVSLDGKPAAEIGSDGMLTLDLGNQDHELEVSAGRDVQKFVLTYTPNPTLTVFVKSDPSTGVLTINVGQDGASIYINDQLYRRVTDHGSIRIPLKVGHYEVRVHLAGFEDPPAEAVDVKKNSEASVQFHLQVVPQFAALQINGAAPGTSAVIDHLAAATVGADGTAKIFNIKPGDHLIEVRHDQAVPKQFTRTFQAGQTITLSGTDVMLDRIAADNKSVIPAAPGPPMIPPPTVPQITPTVAVAAGEQVHKGGGFIPYHTPKQPGRYYFQARTKFGGVLKHGRLEWYAGYQDKDNYLLFSIDGKHAEVKEFRDGKQYDIGKIPFNVTSEDWVQVEMSVKADAVQARAKSSAGDWVDLSPVHDPGGRDLTKSVVGLFVPSNEEVAIANFRFSPK